VADERSIDELLSEAAAGGTELNLRGLGLTEIPPEVFGMTHLTVLILGDSRLSAVPAAIGRLRRLAHLNLSGNELKRLPAELGNLAELRHLDVSSNRLAEVPTSLSRLTHLETLGLWDNQLTTLPDEIWAICTTAAKPLLLDLDMNPITRISPAIARSTIGFLAMRHTRLKALPPELGSASVRQLDLRNNAMTTLPAELGRLGDDVLIYLTDNPLVEPFPSLVERGTPALLAYLRSLGTGTKLYEAKVLLVGEGNVGKSSLVAALREEPFDANRSTTHGIEIGDLTLPHPREPVEVSLKTWDFGGQEVYRVTHQFFFSRRCLYLLVWWPREGPEANDIEGWCRRIRLRIGPDARILLVATHADGRRAELDYPELQRQFGDMVVGSVAVDNESGTGIEDLRGLVAEQVAGLPQMGEVISAKWISARDEVLARRAKVTQIPYDDFMATCKSHDLDDPATTALAGLMHDLGQVIHYGDDDGLRDVVILQPEWLTKAISYVLDDRATAAAGGVLDHRRLREIWIDPARETSYPADVHPYFLRLMEKFDISYRIPDEDRSLVAQLVPYERPSLPWDAGDPLRDGHRELSLVFRPSEDAPGLVPWMTVRNHPFSTGRHWRRGMFLEHHGHDATALVVHRGRDLTLTVRAPSPDYFFAILRGSLEYLARRRWEGLTYELLVPCPGSEDRAGAGARCGGFFEIAALQRYREREIAQIRCHRCLDEFDVTRLLTGFVLPEPEVAQVVAEIRVLAEETRQARQETAAQSAEIASGIRALLKAAASEGADCPRLFTLVPREPSGWKRIKFGKRLFELTLWCEHPGEEHPWAPATYVFERPKEWLAQIAPYALAVSRLLRLAAPIGAAALGAFMDKDDFEDMEKKLELMKALVEKLPEEGLRPLSWSLPAYGPGAFRLHRASGAEARTLRILLHELDRPQALGDLRKVLAPSGEHLWVCPQVHYRAYDPGLPELPT